MAARLLVKQWPAPAVPHPDLYKALDWISDPESLPDDIFTYEVIEPLAEAIPHPDNSSEQIEAVIQKFSADSNAESYLLRPHLESGHEVLDWGFARAIEKYRYLFTLYRGDWSAARLQQRIHAGDALSLIHI